MCKPFIPGHFLISNAYLSRSIFVGLGSIGRCVSHHFSLMPFSLEDFNGYIFSFSTCCTVLLYFWNMVRRWNDYHSLADPSSLIRCIPRQFDSS